MPYRYFENTAVTDVAFEAEGGTLKELFQAAAEAVTNVMVRDPEAIGQRVIRLFEMEASSAEMLLYHFLQEVIYLKDSEQLFFRRCEIDIDRECPAWHLSVQAWGGKIDREIYEQTADIKTVSLPDFRILQTCDGWTTDIILGK